MAGPSIGPAREIPPLTEPFPSIDQQVALVMEGWSADPERVIAGLTTIVNALSVKAAWNTDYRGNERPWTVVARGAEELAYTQYTARQVACTLAPLLDTRLTEDQRSAVLLGILLHEVGHVRGSEDYGDVLLSHAHNTVKRNRGQWMTRAAALTNILEDDRTEADTTATFPVYGQVIRLARWWLVSRHARLTLHAPEWRDEVIPFAGNVIRYRAWVTMADDAKTRREAKWWTAWAARWTFVTPTERIEAMTEAMAHLMKTPERPKPEMPDQPEPEDSESEEDGDGRPRDDGDGEDQPEGEDQPDAGDEDTEDGDPTDSDGDTEDGEDEAEATPSTGQPGRAEDGQPQETLPQHAEDDLTPGERAAAADLGIAQVTSAGTKRMLTVRWQMPPEPKRPLGVESFRLLTPEQEAAEAYRKASADRYAATRVQSGAMGTASGPDGVDVRVRVLDLGRLNLRTGSTVDVARSGINAMAAAFRLYRTRRDNPALSTSGRKIDQRKVYRLGSNDGRVFIRGGNASPEGLDVHLLVDRSGSMGGYALEQCQTMLATIAQAMKTERAVRLTIWSESSGNPINRTFGDSERDHSYLIRHWSTAEGYGVVGARIAALASGGGFHDASAIEAVAMMIEPTPGFRPVIAVLSDGEPIEPKGWIRQVITRQRRKGVAVFGVGMASRLTQAHIEMYGRENLVQFTGDWTALGHGIMRMLARLLP